MLWPDPASGTGVGQDLFLGVAQRVRRAPSDVVQIERVGLQPRLRRR